MTLIVMEATLRQTGDDELYMYSKNGCIRNWIIRKSQLTG